MNIVGRFLAYKAMNAAWRSATRTSSSRNKGVSLHGGALRSPTQTDIRRANFAFLGAGLAILLGLGSCAIGKFGIGLILFWIGTPAVFTTIALLPNRWFRVQPPPRQIPKPPAFTHNPTPTGNRSRSIPDRRRGEETTCADEGHIPTESGGYADEEYDKEAARRAAHIAAYATSDPVAAAAIRRSKRLQLLNRLRNMTPEQFKAEYAAKEDQADWLKNRWAYWEIARELEEAERKNTHDDREREKAARKRTPEAIATQNSTPESAEPTTGRSYVVYFIQEKSEDGNCKVGITYSLESRLRSLQTGNPHELETVHTIQVSNKAAAEQIEEAVLNAIRNAGAELTGEWFQSAILPWARQVAETERERMEGRSF